MPPFFARLQAGTTVQLRPILFINGILLSILALSMTLPMLADFYFGHDDWRVFFICIIITAFFGGAMVLSNTGGDFSLSIREAFILAVSSWVILSIFAALPFWLSSLQMTWTASFFESISSLTTTGATVITDLGKVPAGLLLWRALLQWLGGIGMIVLSVSLLPFLNIGGMQIFRREYADSEKIYSRTMQLVTSLFMLYLGLSVTCALLYMATGLQVFDAVVLSMSTISTGGFSTFPNSFASIDNGATEAVAIVFMIMGCLPFVLYIKAVRGNPGHIFRDMQVRWFLTAVVLSVLVISYSLYSQGLYDGPEALRTATFHTVSLMTGTGFFYEDYTVWGGFCLTVMFFLIAVGGCSGSSTSGIKIFRFQILYSVVKVQLYKLIYPHGVFLPHYNRKPMPADVPVSVMSFLCVYALSFAVISAVLSLTGLDLVTALSATLGCLSNLGTGFGPTVGPLGNYAPLSDFALWALCFAMLLGRLEMFTVLVIFTPYFWRR
ncbi:MAG: TrkH family potassium uptake protein [Alphaproteobacteria bacterium]|nr:TrkH family potassium uptake protein [Alphaproteobacteria bacterium]